MTDRHRLIDGFLAAQGWAGATRTDLAVDASRRRYERITQGGRKAILMDAPPDREPIGRFILIDRYLRGRGYSAPEILGADETNGLMLLEDLGDDVYTDLIDGGDDTEALFAAATDLLIGLHDEAPDALPVAALDTDRLLGQVEILLDLYLPEITGSAASDDQRRGFLDAWRTVLPLADALPRCLVLYDYHAPNLIWLPQRRGLARVGLLDFQDAMIGPIAFDVVSLLENPRQDTDAALAEAMVARYLEARPEIDGDDFRCAYALLGAQRATRNLGNFTRLWRRENKPGYMDHIPRLWRLLEGSLAHAALAPVAAWYDQHIPRHKRRSPL